MPIVRKRLMAAIDELNQSARSRSGSRQRAIVQALEALMESADRAMYEEKRARGQRTASIDPHAAPSPRE